MISSLLQQNDCPPIVLDIACKKGNGNPTTKDVVDFFSTFLSFSSKRIPISFVFREFEDKDSHTFNHRGLIRNIQLKECKTEWMLFSDSDMVYHPDFFSKLKNELVTQHKYPTYMLITGRMTGDPREFSKVVNKEYYPSLIHGDPFDKLKYLAKKQMRTVGAGFFQLVHMKYAPHGGFYVLPDECRDWNMEKKGSNPKSDMQFRKRIGSKVSLPEWFTHNQIHINHNRDPEAKQHITEQR